MGKKIRVFIALAIIIGVSVWSFSAVREKTYSGSKIAFPVGSGSLIVTNSGSEPIPVEMRNTNSRGNFRIESAALNLREASKRLKIGNTAYQGVKFMLPPGQAEITVVRGSKVLFLSGSDQPIQAVVTPMSASSARATWFYTAVVVLAALYYISRTFEHSWIRSLRQRMRGGTARIRRAPG